VSLRTEDSIRTALEPYGARKDPAAYADEIASSLLVAAKRTVVVHPLSGSARPIDLASIRIRALFRAKRPTSVSFQISRPEPSKRGVKRIRPPVRDET